MSQLNFNKRRLMMSTKMVGVERVLKPQNKQSRWSGNTLSVKLYVYQRRAVRQAMKQGSLGLWMEQGTGKTLTALKYAGNLWKQGKIDNVLILGPKSVLTVWEEELKHFLIPYQIVTDPLTPSSKQEKLTICLTNYESLRRYKGKASKLKNSYDLVIADESHRIKNHNSIQSKQTYFLARNAKYRLALSGTPKGNNDWDFIGQYRFIDDSIFGYKIKEIREKYFQPCGWMMHDLELQPQKKEEFYDLIRQHSFRITKSEALDLPEITETKIKVELSKPTMKAYRQLVEDKLLELVDSTIEADLAVKLVTKLQQICCGFIYDEEHTPIEIGDDKIKYLKEIIEDHSNEKIVIFCKYTHEIDMISKALINKVNHIIYDSRSKIDGWLEFVRNPYLKVLITQIKKGGTGLNLQCASTVIFFSLSYSYIDLSQAKDRVHRNGQTKKVSIYYLLGKNTIEENIYKVLQQKKSGAKEILDNYRVSL